MSSLTAGALWPSSTQTLDSLSSVRQVDVPLVIQNPIKGPLAESPRPSFACFSDPPICGAMHEGQVRGLPDPPALLIPWYSCFESRPRLPPEVVPYLQRLRPIPPCSSNPASRPLPTGPLGLHPGSDHPGTGWAAVYTAESSSRWINGPLLPLLTSPAVPLPALKNFSCPSLKA